MGGDVQFFFDVNDGMHSDWRNLPEKIAPGQSIVCSRNYRTAAGRYHLEFDWNGLLEGAVNGKPFDPAGQVETGGQAASVVLNLKHGENEVTIRLHNPTETEQEPMLKTRLLDADWELVADPVKLEELPPPENCRPEPELSGFRPGAGAAFKTCGRFGFTKGDGVLDYSMPGFGIVSRPFITGNPRYHRPNLWNFSLLPEGEKTSASLFRTYEVPENETVSNDWSHVRWERRLKNGKILAFDYSLLSPSLLIESDLDSLRLSNLTDIGGFRRITLPLTGEAVVRPLTEGEIYNAETDGACSENWLLLSHSGSFPEVPVLLVFQHSPCRIEAHHLPGGSLESLTIFFDGELKWTMLQMPYGFELFEPHELTGSWHQNTIRLCRKRQREMLARPEACAEYFRFENGRMHIIQEFEFREFADSHRTPSCKIAPLPPPLALAAPEVKTIQLDEHAEDLAFPTKYGPLHGVRNSRWSEYFVPVESSRCEIAFPARKAAEFGQLIHQDFDDFLKYHLEAPEVGNPGCYSFVFQYAFVARLLPVLQEEDRRRLQDAMLDGLRKVCDPDYQYIGPGGRTCFSWYQRTEPISKVSWYSTYLHVTGISRYKNCDRETIENSPFPMIEIDWGNAMALYGAALAAQLTGQWEMIRRNWQVFRKVFDYFLVMMDWACMTTAYAENGITWNDGTNYGAYTAYLNMAEMTGNTEDYELARYAFAKMTAMRLGLYFSSQKYFCLCQKTEPSYSSKFFHEETTLQRAFANYPASSVYGQYRCGALYNLTTEGHYKEAWNLYWESAPEETKTILTLFERAANCPLTGPFPPGIEPLYHTMKNRIGHQEVMTYLMFCIMSERFSPQELEKMINDAAANGRISRGMLGTELSKRRVPAEWARVYLLTMLYGQKQPKLTFWNDLEIVSAAYPELEIRVCGESPWLEFSAKEAPAMKMNGQALKVQPCGNHLFRVRPEKSGLIRFE